MNKAKPIRIFLLKSLEVNNFLENATFIQSALPKYSKYKFLMQFTQNIKAI